MNINTIPYYIEVNAGHIRLTTDKNKKSKLKQISNVMEQVLKDRTQYTDQDLAGIIKNFYSVKDKIQKRNESSRLSNFIFGIKGGHSILSKLDSQMDKLNQSLQGKEWEKQKELDKVVKNETEARKLFLNGKITRGDYRIWKNPLDSDQRVYLIQQLPAGDYTETITIEKHQNLQSKIKELSTTEGQWKTLFDAGYVAGSERQATLDLSNEKVYGYKIWKSSSGKFNLILNLPDKKVGQKSFTLQNGENLFEKIDQAISELKKLDKKQVQKNDSAFKDLLDAKKEFLNSSLFINNGKSLTVIGIYNEKYPTAKITNIDSVNFEQLVSIYRKLALKLNADHGSKENPDMYKNLNNVWDKFKASVQANRTIQREIDKHSHSINKDGAFDVNKDVLNLIDRLIAEEKKQKSSSS